MNELDKFPLLYCCEYCHAMYDSCEICDKDQTERCGAFTYFIKIIGVGL